MYAQKVIQETNKQMSEKEKIKLTMSRGGLIDSKCGMVSHFAVCMERHSLRMITQSDLQCPDLFESFGHTKRGMYGIPTSFAFSFVNHPGGRCFGKPSQAKKCKRLV